MTTTIDNNSSVSDATQIDNTDSPYLTQGEQEIQVDSSSGSVTVTLASADLASGREIKIIDSGLNAGTNNITIETEGTETINPGSNSSISISIDGGYEEFFSDGDNLFSSRNRDTATIDSLNGTSADYDLVNTDASRTAKTHVPDAADSIQTVLNNNSGEIVDMAGQTLEVTSPLSVPDNTTLRNGTIKLADGADADIFYTEDPQNIRLDNVTWDLNGENQSTDALPTNQAYWTLHSPSSTGGQGTRIYNNKWVNGSGRVTSATDMLFIRADHATILDPTIRLGSYADYLFFSNQQMSIINPRIVGNNRGEFAGGDGSVVGGQMVNNDIPIMFNTGGGPRDWEFGGGLIVEENRQGVFVSDPISEWNIIHFGDVQFQGHEQWAVTVNTGGAETGRLVFDGCNFKRNGFQSDGQYPQFRMDGGDRVVIRNVTATNRNDGTTQDANYFVDITSNASNAILDHIDALNSDFTSGTAINDNGIDTNIGQTFTT